MTPPTLSAASSRKPHRDAAADNIAPVSRAVSLPAMSANDPFLGLWREPHRAAHLDNSEWNAVLQLGRASRCLGRLAGQLRKQPGLWPKLPDRVRLHFEADEKECAFQERVLRWEVQQIAECLALVGVRPVFLKGAAYIVAGMQVALGRRISDLDILVPLDQLDRVEKQLHADGWRSAPRDQYDDHYYREWMHELPPLFHERRGSVLDVHHTILPPIGRVRIDPQRLLESACVVQTPHAPVATLGPEDMLLHSAAHAFHDGDFSQGLRDVIDIDQLLGEFRARDAEFEHRLVDRAEQHGLTRPLYYAIQSARDLLGTPFDDHAWRRLATHQPLAVVRGAMGRAIRQAVVPALNDGGSLAGDLARLALYVRSHYLRMPLLLLIKHLSVKASKKLFPPTKPPKNQPA